MRLPRAVNEAVQVKVQTRSTGEVLVQAFAWQGRWFHVGAHGRRWEEQGAGRRLCCFLVQSLDMSTFELHWDPVEDRWVLHQAWHADMV